MYKIALLMVTAALVVAAAPVQGTHSHTVDQPYFAGGTVQVDGAFVGATVCGPVADLGLGCIGGGIVNSEHAGEEDTANGYTQATATATDALSGPNVGLSICLKNQDDDAICDGSNDIQAFGCGLAISVNTNEDEDDDPGYQALFTVLFARIVYVESATNVVCVASNGSLAVTFDA